MRLAGGAVREPGIEPWMNDAELQKGDDDDRSDFDDGIANAEDNDNDSDECDGEKDHRYFWLATEIFKGNSLDVSCA